MILNKNGRMLNIEFNGHVKEIKVPFKGRNLGALDEYIHATLELKTFWFLDFEV